MNSSQETSPFSKLKRFFACLALTATLLSLLLLILSETGFSLGLNRPQIGRLTLYLVILAGLLNLREIKAIIDKALSKKDQKKFFWLTLANIALIAIFIFIYSIFQYGSPLIYEDHPVGFYQIKQTVLVAGETISQEFRATSDNLGTVGIKLSVQEKTLTRDDQGEIIEVIEAEELVASDEEKLNPNTIEPEITTPTSAEIIFRIKEKGSDDWFYENSYYFDQASPLTSFPFGFPLQESSDNKEYLVEIEGTQETTDQASLYVFIPLDRLDQPYTYSRYVYSQGDNLPQNLKLIALNSLKKVALNFKKESFNFSLIVMVGFLEINAFLFTKKSKKRFRAIIQKEFSDFLIIYLSLAIIVQLAKLATRFTNLNLPDTQFIDEINNAFLIIVVILGSFIALTDKKS